MEAIDHLIKAIDHICKAERLLHADFGFAVEVTQGCLKYTKDTIPYPKIAMQTEVNVNDYIEYKDDKEALEYLFEHWEYISNKQDGIPLVKLIKVIDEQSLLYIIKTYDINIDLGRASYYKNLTTNLNKFAKLLDKKFTVQNERDLKYVEKLGIKKKYCQFEN